jgi:hypothetical protein
MGCLGQAADAQLIGRRVGQFGAVFPIEMRVVIHAGVKIASRAIDHDFLHQPRGTKGTQCVVDGGKTDLLTGLT